MAKMHIDAKQYSKKPDSTEIRYISNRITGSAEDVTAEQLANKMVGGHSVVLATMNGKRAKSNMIQQQVIMLDFDNKEAGIKTEGMFYTSLEDILADDFIQENASFAYTTFSHEADWDKFRVVFFLNKPLTNIQEVTAVYNYLLAMYPNADKACKDPSRVFYGGQQAFELNYSNKMVVTAEMLATVEEAKEKKVKEERAYPARDVKIVSTGPKANWELIKEGDIKELQKRFADCAITLPSAPAAHNYIKTINLYDVLGVEGNPFLDIFREEQNPSASCFQMEDTTIWLYHSFTSDDGKPWNGDIVKVIGRLRGCSWVEALKFAISAFNIKIEVSEQVKAIREQVDLFMNFLTQEDLKKSYPSVFTIFWRYKNDLVTTLNIFKENIYEDANGELRCLTWMSVRTLALRLYGDANKYSRASDILNLLTLTRWIDKLDEPDIPTELFTRLKEAQEKRIKATIAEQKQHGQAVKHPRETRRSNVFELFLLADDFFDQLNNQCEEMKQHNFTMMGFSWEWVARTHGKELANKIFPQDKHRELTKTSDKQMEAIRDTIGNMIEEQGYAVIEDVKKAMKRRFKSKLMADYKYKQTISSLLDGYGWERVQMNKDLKSYFGLDVKSKEKPFILVKEGTKKASTMAVVDTQAKNTQV